MRHNPDFVARQVGEELVLVPVTRTAAELESIFTLNQVGARIWNLVETCADEEEIAGRLAEEYEVEEADALADVRELLEQLVAVRALLAA
jgi:hypothetical protein